jgi:hypothetical protein
MKFTLPENLADLSVEDLIALRDKALDEYGDISKTPADDLTDEQVDRIEYLATAVDALQAEKAGRETAASARTERAASALETMAAAKKKAEEEKTNAEKVADLPKTGVVDEGDPKVSEHEQEVLPTGGAGTRVSASLVRGARKGSVPVPVNTAGGGFTITAAADVPGSATGSPLENLTAVAKAFANRAKVFRRPDAGTAPQFSRFGVASLTRTVDENTVVLDGDAESDYEKIMSVGKESRLSGGSLVASGGWCAPSETFYDLCETESLDGLIDVPEVQVKRGGIRFTKGPDFSTIYNNTGFFQTEAQAIAGTEKTCFEVQCPSFEEVRLDVIGLCVKAPILTNVGYPELVQRWLSGTMVAHQHKVSARVINSMVAEAGAAVALGSTAGAFLDLLGSLEWIAETQRYRYRLAFSETLEVVLPHWALAIIRQDIALRNGQDAPVTDAQINAHLANRGVRAQWVTDWQPLITAGGKACLADVPANVEMLVYPAGTFVKGTADVISLDAVYDTTDLVHNMYTAAFVEEGILVANRCYDACRFTMPTTVRGAQGGSLAATLDWIPTGAPVA